MLSQEGKKMASQHVQRNGNLTPEQRRMAERARSRARFLVAGKGAEGGMWCFGGLDESQRGVRCERCLGRGFLSCIACCE